MDIDRAALEATLAEARRQLLAARLPSGHWQGELSSSALSTATATVALALADREAHSERVESGLRWLADHQNADGGWGDTVLSVSNISTTMLCWSAFGAAGEGRFAEAVARVEAWLERAAGGLSPRALSEAVIKRYGRDRTFSAPILTTCALAGRLGPGREAWRWVIPLPFELAACPHKWFKWLRLPVVSYALPALVAIGQARYHHRPPWNPLVRLIRSLARGRTLEVARAMQPESGGYLEAVPITSFVTMSLVSIGQGGHPIVAKAVQFLLRTRLGDGSWPIDANLATWVTTLSVNAVGGASLPRDERQKILDWLLAQQHREEHPYTRAEPGGWAWTDLSGGVPDADDTAGALIALRHLGPGEPRARDAAERGIRWLLGLQNRDGGIPTFCRGWGALPFDRSAADLTAHALSAMAAWLGDLAPALRRAAEAAMGRALAYLARVQRGDGAWLPLWFGNQFAPDDENPTYGTARVLMALCGAAERSGAEVLPMLERGARWLLAAQNADGGWGGAPGTPSSVEETALALDALARVLPLGQSDEAREGVARGTAWLVAKTKGGQDLQPSPIGFYFAKLWYYERLYPAIFTVGALERVRAATASLEV